MRLKRSGDSVGYRLPPAKFGQHASASLLICWRLMSVQLENKRLCEGLGLTCYLRTPAVVQPSAFWARGREACGNTMTLGGYSLKLV
jgi:hypothetical protein